MSGIKTFRAEVGRMLWMLLNRGHDQLSLESIVVHAVGTRVGSRGSRDS